jgi:hypothetical protein
MNPGLVLQSKDAAISDVSACQFLKPQRFDIYFACDCWDLRQQYLMGSAGLRTVHPGW